MRVEIRLDLGLTEPSPQIWAPDIGEPQRVMFDLSHELYRDGVAGWELCLPITIELGTRYGRGSVISDQVQLYLAKLLDCWSGHVLLRGKLGPCRFSVTYRGSVCDTS